MSILHIEHWILKEPVAPVENSEPEKKEPEKKPDEPEPKPHKDRFQQRINQLVSKNKAMAERLEALERQKAPNQQETKLSRDQFFTDEQYIDAVTEQKLQARLPEVAKQFVDTSKSKEIEKNFLAKEAKAKQDIEDYDDAIAEAADIPVQPSVADAILSSDIGPNLRYYLATHPEEAEELNSMSPGAAARKIGRIETKLEAEISQKKEVKKVSKAPDPVKPVNAGGEAQAVVDLNDPKMSLDDWMKKRREQKLKAHAPLKRIT